MTWKIPLFKIYYDDEDVKSVTKTIEKGMHWAIGPNIQKFEKMITEYIGMKYCVVFNSGTSALHALLMAHDIKGGDEVIVPSFTFISTANAPLFVGAKPVFADIEERTFGLSPDDVNEKITKNTKAIIPIRYGGCGCQIRELKKIAEDNSLILIEDAAESMGAKIGERMVGTFGDSSMFSFCANKVISTGEGGCFVTNSQEIHDKAKLIASHGRLESQNYFSSDQYMDYVTLGYNLRMSNITAALGISQLGKIAKIIGMRRSNAEYMTKKLTSIKGLEPPKPPNDYLHTYQMYTVKIEEGKKVRDDLKEFLVESGIMSKVYFEPVHKTHFFRKELGIECSLPTTEKISSQVLTLPMYPTLDEDKINYITDKIVTFFQRGE
jgi:perosamine synthetase